MAAARHLMMSWPLQSIAGLWLFVYSRSFLAVFVNVPYDAGRLQVPLVAEEPLRCVSLLDYQDSLQKVPAAATRVTGETNRGNRPKGLEEVHFRRIGLVSRRPPRAETRQRPN